MQIISSVSSEVQTHVMSRGYLLSRHYPDSYNLCNSSSKMFFESQRLKAVFLKAKCSDNLGALAVVVCINCHTLQSEASLMKKRHSTNLKCRPSGIRALFPLNFCVYFQIHFQNCTQEANMVPAFSSLHLYCILAAISQQSVKTQSHVRMSKLEPKPVSLTFKITDLLRSQLPIKWDLMVLSCNMKVNCQQCQLLIIKQFKRLQLLVPSEQF